MKLYINGKDVTNLMEKINWSGDHKQVARQVDFTIAKSHSDPYFPEVRYEAGDLVVLQNAQGLELFLGIIFKVDRASSAVTVSYTAFDLMFYVFNSEGSWVIDETPEAFTARVCAEFGIKLEFAQETGVHVYSLALKKTGYQAIMMAYTEAYRQNNGKYAYIPLMRHDALCVIPKGMDSEVVLESGYNLIDANLNEDATKIVNKVKVTDKEGNPLFTVDDAESQAKYGVIQKVISQEEGKDATAEAETMLTKLERVAKAEGLSDFRAVAGYSLLIRDPDTGLLGRFQIENDKHSFIDGKATMSLSIAFESVMDEVELEQGGK